MRIFLALLAALAANIVVVGGSEFLIHSLFPPAPDTDLSRPADMAAIVTNMPLAAKLLVLCAWAAGALAAAYVALAVSKGVRSTAWAAVALPLFGVVYSVVSISHPWWMTLIGIAIPPLAALIVTRSWRGGRPVPA